MRSVCPPMTWHVQYRKEGSDRIVRTLTPEAAIETACRLIDEGSDVFGIGTGPLTDTIARNEIARIYAIWTRVKNPFAQISTKPPDAGLIDLGAASPRPAASRQ